MPATMTASSAGAQPPAPAARSGTRQAPAWKTLTVGAASGLTSCVLLQPIDLLKTRLQQERAMPAQAGRERMRLLDAVRTVVRDDGWHGLWRGTVPTIARNVPGVAAYFYTVNELRWFVASWQVPWLSLHVGQLREREAGAHASPLARLSTAGNLVTGAVARVGIGLLLNPVTIVKARFESSHYSREAYPTIASALREIYREDGVRGLFRGFSATAVRDAPYSGLYLAIYEQSKVACSRMLAHYGAPPNSTGDWRVVSTSGLVAGTLATVLTHPFDIIKTRMQTTPPQLLAASETPAFWATMQHILRTDGLRGYADGLVLRCTRKAASSVIGWTIFELGNQWVSA